MLKYTEDSRTIVFCFLSLASYNYYWFNFKNNLIFLIVSLQSFQMSVIVHNCAHTYPFKYALLNNIFFIFLTLLSGSPTSLYIPGHNKSHHLHLETEKDMMRTTKMKYKNEFLNLVLFAPSVLPDIIKNERVYMLFDKRVSILYLHCQSR